MNEIKGKKLHGATTPLLLSGNADKKSKNKGLLTEILPSPF
jgi:hypothetical protein